MSHVSLSARLATFWWLVLDALIPHHGNVIIVWVSAIVDSWIEITDPRPEADSLDVTRVLVGTDVLGVTFVDVFGCQTETVPSMFCASAESSVNAPF